MISLVNSRVRRRCLSNYAARHPRRLAAISLLQDALEVLCPIACRSALFLQLLVQLRLYLDLLRQRAADVSAYFVHRVPQSRRRQDVARLSARLMFPEAK